MTKVNNNVVMIFEPHPDDADWWTGGLSLLLAKMGWKVHYISVGTSSDEEKNQAESSAKILGISRQYLDIAIGDNEHFKHDLRRKIPPLLLGLSPRLVFIPSLIDYHQEHVAVAKALFELFHWSAGTGLGSFEVYAYDSHENRDPVEIYIDVSSVWNKHIESLRCYTEFERPTIPENTLIRTKTGRAMTLGASIPAAPVLYAEGYRLLQGDVKKYRVYAPCSLKCFTIVIRMVFLRCDTAYRKNKGVE